MGPLDLRQPDRIALSDRWAHMRIKIFNVSRTGAKCILAASVVMLLLLWVFLYHSFIINGETSLFLALIALAILRLLVPDS